MYKVAICDDEQKQRELVKNILIRLSVKSNLDFEFMLFNSGEELVSYYENNGASFHFLILDIEMNGLNGIETARKIRGLKKTDEQIIFLTSYPKYMMDSFDVVTFQYLLKPVNECVFEEKIIKLCQYFQSLEKKFIIVKSGYEEILLKHDDIVAIEVEKSLTIKNKIHFITKEKTIESKGIITTYAEALKDYNFIQIHRAIIINLLHVKKFAGGNVVMSNGEGFPIGRSKVKHVKDIYTKFMITRI